MKPKVHHMIAKGVIPSRYLVEGISQIQERSIVICTQDIISVELKTCKEVWDILPLLKERILYDVMFVIILERIIQGVAVNEQG